MVLQARPIAFTASVIAFFVLGIVGSIVGLPTYTCSKRSMLGALVVYVVASIAIHAVNAILTQAMIANQISKDHAGDSKN